ncbi:MAG: substrate-binding domain-containing protein [Flavobacteriaceae bacterium]|nr:substrate-binding domain-containing protein [Flavobacteriaceae bacterium]
MENKKITIKELAKILGVSVSTVSKALNDSYEISEKTKLKVQKAAKKYHYKPNRLAVNLKSGKTKNIGVIIPNILNTFFTRVLYGIERIAASEDYNIITCFSRESYQKEVANIELLSNGSIDGLIVAIAEESQIKGDFEHFKEAISGGIPMVMFDRVTDVIACDKVVVDDFNNAFNATKYLLDLNCKQVALITTIDLLSVGKLRNKGYKNAMVNSSNNYNEKLVIKSNVDDVLQEILNLLDNEKIDGIFAIDEDASLAAIKAVKMKGYQIPNDISIIGYANEKIAKNLTPSLTTVNQHGITIGKTATKLLIERLKNDKEEIVTKIIATNIDQRSSTKKGKTLF